MNRNICIVTWFGTGNYGSNIQAIGLSKTLANLEYSPYFMGKFKVHGFLLRYPVLLYARVTNKINQKKQRAFFSPVPYTLSEARKARLQEFKDDHFKVKNYNGCNQWKRDIDNHIIFACGSDILWNPARGYPAINFLDIAYYAKVPRFSYASSIGALDLPKKYHNAYKRYIGSMIEVGVREEAAADLIEPIIGRRPTKVVDPSLLLTADQWGEFATKAKVSVKINPAGYALCYFVMNDSRYWEYVKKAKEATGLQIIVLPMHYLDEEQGYDTVLDGTPYEFIWLIMHATLICTDSFHACVASTLFHKEFYLLKRSRKSEDAKYDDFLGRYHLMDRIVKTENRFIRNRDIDYSYADELIKRDRQFSLDFLKDTLAKCEI